MLSFYQCWIVIGLWTSTNPRNPTKKILRPGWDAENSPNSPTSHTLRGQQVVTYPFILSCLKPIFRDG